MAATASLLPPLLRVTDSTNAPVSGATIECFDGGTTTPKTLYSDADLSVSLGTSVTCDSAGYPTSTGTTKTLLYVNATTATKLVFKNSSGTTLVTHDNIPGGVDINDVAALVEFAKSQMPTVSLTSATTLGSTHYGKMILANPTGGSFALTLPSAATAANGTRIKVRHDGTSGTVSVTAAGADQIKSPSGTGAAYQLTTAQQEVELVSTGSGWIASALYNGTGTITTDMLSSAISGAFKKVGDIGLFFVETVPAGWLELDGQAVSRTTYSSLFAIWSTAFGIGDGSTTFNLPDMRGRVPRGWAHGSSTDPDRASRTDRGDGTTGDKVGSKQAGAVEGHSHTAGTLAADSGGAHSHTWSNTFGSAQSGGGVAPVTNPATSGGTNSVTTSSGGAHTHTISGTTGTTSGTETRMVNISVMFCVFADPSAATGSSAPLNTILHGTGAPNDAIGVNGDFYLDISSTILYGPKTSGTWTGVDLLRLGINPRGPWITATAYKTRDLVSNGGATYIALSDHTSGASTEPGTGASYLTVWGVFSASGTGDVTGPGSSTDNAIARFDSTTGKLLQNSSATVNDSGSVNVPTGQAYSINGAARLTEVLLALDAAGVITINSVQVLGARRTGWTVATGTATRTTFATGSVTLAQLAERVKALQDDLIAHGIIGT
jgi:microcystin-dependent protein